MKAWKNKRYWLSKDGKYAMVVGAGKKEARVFETADIEKGYDFNMRAFGAATKSAFMSHFIDYYGAQPIAFGNVTLDDHGEADVVDFGTEYTITICDLVQGKDRHLTFTGECHGGLTDFVEIEFFTRRRKNRDMPSTHGRVWEVDAHTKRNFIILEH